MRLFALLRLRLRIGLDELVTYGVTALAIGLAVAYQLLGRWLRKDETGSPSE